MASAMAMAEPPMSLAGILDRFMGVVPWSRPSGRANLTGKSVSRTAGKLKMRAGCVPRPGGSARAHERRALRSGARRELELGYVHARESAGVRLPVPALDRGAARRAHHVLVAHEV